jgi:hypothetical protein
MNSFEIPGRVDFSISEAKWLADLHGIENDLRDTDKLCTKSLTLMRPLPTGDADAAKWLEDSWLAGELSFAAVVKYGRTFGSGVRAGIPISWIDRLPVSHQQWHQYFKNIRDKFIAHSVNAFEDNQVFAQLSPQFAPAEVSSITVDTGRFVSMSSSDVLSLKGLAGLLKQLVQHEIAQESSRLLQVARAMPLGDLLARSTDNRPLPRNEDVSKPRFKA